MCLKGSIQSLPCNIKLKELIIVASISLSFGVDGSHYGCDEPLGLEGRGGWVRSDGLEDSGLKCRLRGQERLVRAAAAHQRKLQVAFRTLGISDFQTQRELGLNVSIFRASGFSAFGV